MVTVKTMSGPREGADLATHACACGLHSKASQKTQCDPNEAASQSSAFGGPNQRYDSKGYEVKRRSTLNAAELRTHSS